MSWFQLRVPAASVVFLVPLLALSCSASKSNDGAILVLSPHNEDIREEFAAGFAAWHQEQFGAPARIEWADQGGTVTMLRHILSEFSTSPGGIGIDVLFGGGVEPYLELEARGHLESYRLPEDVLSRLPETFSGLPMWGEGYTWYGAALSGFGIIHNKPLLAGQGVAPPGDWEDLADPALLTWVGSADPRQSGSVHMVYEIIFQAYGWEKGWDIVTRLGGNVRKFSSSASTLPRDVASGEMACAMAIDLYAWAQEAESGSERVGFVLPDGLTVINPDGIAILKGAPNLEGSRRFLDYVFSDAGQKLWMLPKGDPEGPKTRTLFRLGVFPDLYGSLGDRLTVPVNPFQMRDAVAFQMDVSQKRYVILNDLLGALIVDSHRELQSAWKAVIDAGLPGDALAELVRPPITEAEALQLAESSWDDQVFRNNKIAEWVRFARGKYQSAAQRARDAE